MTERLLYENNYEKPDLTEEFLEHHGIKGQKWGVQNGPPYPLGSVVKKKIKQVSAKVAAKKKPVYKSNEQALKERDLKYISSHKSQFSTNEMNTLINRISTEQKLDKLAKQSSSKAKSKINKFFKSKKFKVVAGITIAGLVAATSMYYKGIKSGNRLPDYSRPPYKEFLNDFYKIFKKEGHQEIKRNLGRAGKYI